MKQRLYSIRDRKVGYMQPVIRQNDEVAVRDFFLTLSQTDSDNVFKIYPADFDLYFVGYFDSESGEFEHVLPVFLVSGTDAYIEG